MLIPENEIPFRTSEGIGGHMKLLSVAVIGSVLANPGTELDKRPVFVAAAFARLASRTPELEKRFTWPATATFQATHQQIASATPLRLIGGRCTLESKGEMLRRQVVVVLDPTPGGGVLQTYAATPSGDYEVARGLGRVPAEVWLASGHKELSYTVDGVKVKVTFEPTADGPSRPVDGASWTDWTYATTLLALPQPVYVQEPPGDDRWGPKQKSRGQRASEHLARIEAAIEKGNAKAALTAIDTALATSVDETGVWSDFAWEKAAAWAEEQRAFDAAMGIRARFRPVGRCSMDTGPQAAATAYADLCYAAGKLGCFLDLQVQVMGDQFERVAYSSYGEAAHETRSDRLRNIGIDPARFLRGLVFRYAVAGAHRRELDPWRLARSMKEAGLGADMLAFLRSAATRPELDTFNRMRAAETYAYLRFHNETPANRFTLDDKTRRTLLTNIRAELVGFNLPEPAASWASGFGKSD